MERSLESAPPYEPNLVSDLIPIIDLLAIGLSERLSTHLQASEQRKDLSSVIMTFVKFNRSLPIQLGDLAEHLNRSKSRTGAIVRELFNCTFAALLRRARIDGAKNLLTLNHLRVADVARATGFDDPLYFSRCFKAETGLSPKDWQANRAPPV